jgi:phosphoribosylglycinamide formyltransferase-1
LSEEIIAYTDGGSRGNPGPAAAAFILTDLGGTRLCAKAHILDQATNNVAEYTAIRNALKEARQWGVKRITLYSDSELIVRQLNGQYKVKSEQLRPFWQQSMELLNEFDSWQILHIRREKNEETDRMVNMSLDRKRDIVQRGKAGAGNSSKRIRLGVLISGGGTTLMNLLDCVRQGSLNAEIPLVISSRSTALGVERARAAGLDVKIVRRKDFADIDLFSKRIEEELTSAKVDLVIQAGWLCLWKIPARYENAVMNIHPALLPSFGGQGMWGHHVHEAVIAAGCKVSGCTVHFCTNEYDKGPIIVQRCCEVKDDDTAEMLAARVFEQECIAYPEAIRLFQEREPAVKKCECKN